MPDGVLIVGAGPAGSTAALVLARAGVQVHIIDRASFPRDKLCGDSVNPGALALLRRHGLANAVEANGVPIRGMLVTGPGGAAVDGRYADGVVGRSLRRRDLDRLLLDAAIRAGAHFEPDVRVSGPALSGVNGARTVHGVLVRTGDGTTSERRSRLLIAADGRRSCIAFGLGLANHPARPRRWALGAYFEGTRGLDERGEMHIRKGRYIGVAPVPGGLSNVCVVVPDAAARSLMHAPAVALEAALVADEQLRARFETARRVTDVQVLGPLAVDVTSAGVPGLLLAGDAAGFIDPMTGDGLRLALRGGELAAEAALGALEERIAEPHVWLQARRQAEFGGKLRVNRLLRMLVAHPLALGAASLGARALPSLIERLVEYAGDVNVEAATDPRT
jgi:flavin-dependent dehydrogenase